MTDLGFTPIQTAVADRYTLVRQLGEGGMGVVYLAQDVKHHRDVALKVLRPDLSEAVGGMRFLREIEITARLQHPHILPLYDSGQVGRLLYYVMPYVSDESLRDRLAREKPLSLEETLRITRCVADALTYAHGHNVVHRDIKPENIMLSGNHAMVADFGIARAITECCDNQTLTAIGLPLGTPAYMSPEQAAGTSELDGRSDIYSLGCVVYEMLTGRPPYTGPTVSSVLKQHLTADPPSLRAFRAGVPAGVERVVQRALAKTPDARFQGAAEFVEALEAAGRRSLEGAPAGGRRSRTMLVTGATALVLFAIAAAWGPISALFEQREATAAGGVRDQVLVADFDGPEDEAMLVAAARDLVTAALDQSRVVRTVPEELVRTVLRLAGRPDTTRIHADLARELAYRSGTHAVVDGRITHLGGGYSIVVRVVHAEDGEVLLSVSGVASGEGDLVATVDRLARELRQQLGERHDAIAARHPAVLVSTPSFEAYRKYVRSLEAQEDGDLAGSMVLLREALMVDPDFASAWAARGTIFLRNYNADSAEAAFAEALRRGERLTDAERVRLEALTAWVSRYDLAAALTGFDLLVRQNPDAPGVQEDRALVLLALGRYEEALAAVGAPSGARAALGATHEQLAQPFGILVALGRLDEARRVASGFSGSHRVFADMVLAAAADDWAQARMLADTLANDAGAPFEFRGLGIAAFAAGQAARGAVDSADRALERLWAGAVQNGHPPGARWARRAQLLLRLASGRQVGAAPASRDTSTAGLVTLGLWAAAGGDTGAARRLLHQVRARPRADVARVGTSPDLLEGWIHARAGRWSEVVRILAPAVRRVEDDPVLVDRGMRFERQWLVANAYERQGRLDSAAAYFELVAAPTRLPPITTVLRGLVDPYAHQRLVLLYARLNRPADAQRHWEHFSNAFTTPDPDQVALLEQARAAVAQLGAAR